MDRYLTPYFLDVLVKINADSKVLGVIASNYRKVYQVRICSWSRKILILLKFLQNVIY